MVFHFPFSSIIWDGSWLLFKSPCLLVARSTWRCAFFGTHFPQAQRMFVHFYHVGQSFAGLGWGGADNVPWHLTCCYASTYGYATRTWVWCYADRRCCYACAYLAHTSSYSWKCGLYVQNVLNRCWICVEFIWIICRIYVDCMSNKCWIDVEYIQSRLEANQWTSRLCWSYMVKPVGFVYGTTDRCWLDANLDLLPHVTSQPEARLWTACLCLGPGWNRCPLLVYPWDFCMCLLGGGL